MPRSRWRPTRRAWRPRASAAIARAGVNRVSLGVQSLDDADLRALGRLHTVDGGAGGDRRCARDLRALLLRPDLRPARPDAAGLAGGAGAGAGAGRPAPVALPAHHRGRDAVRRRCTRAASSRVPDGELAHDLYELTQELTERAGLPAYEISNHAAPGRGVPPQPALLALRRIRGHRPGRARPRRDWRRAPRHVDRAPAGALGRARRGGRARRRARARRSAAPSRPTRRC